MTDSYNRRIKAGNKDVAGDIFNAMLTHMEWRRAKRRAISCGEQELVRPLPYEFIDCPEIPLHALQNRYISNLRNLTHGQRRT